MIAVERRKQSSCAPRFFKKLTLRFPEVLNNSIHPCLDGRLSGVARFIYAVLDFRTLPIYRGP